MSLHPYANWERHLLYEQDVQERIFETDLLNFEQNRMYPPRYRKEPPMKKLTLDHSEAVSAAKLNMIRIADQATTPKFRAEIEKRVTLLGEVYWWVLDSIYHPGLPSVKSPPNADYRIEPLVHNEAKPEPEEPENNGSTNEG